MADPFRNLRRAWHLGVGTSRYDHVGVRLRTDANDLPKSVRGHISKGGYENVEAELVQKTVRSGDRVLEVGTGIGFVSTLCAKLAGEGRVTSYEANPALGQIIAGNYAENGLTPDLRMRAVTCDGAPIRFFADPQILSSSLIDRDLPSEEITVEADAMTAAMADVAPDVIVMDVEGAEVDLLPAADLSAVRAHIVGDAQIKAMDAGLASQGLHSTQKRHKTVQYQRSEP